MTTTLSNLDVTGLIQLLKDVTSMLPELWRMDPLKNRTFGGARFGQAQTGIAVTAYWSAHEKEIQEQRVLLHEVKERLVQIGPSATAGLQTLLRDDEAFLRVQATEVLGRLRVVTALVESLQDKHHAVRTEAASWLGHVGDASYIPTLLKALKDPYPGVGKAAAAALQKIGWRSSSAGDTADHYVALQDWSELEKMGSSAVPALVQKLAKCVDETVRRSVASTLDRIDAQQTIDRRGAAGLVQSLKHEDPRVRARAASLLGEMGGATAVPALLESLKDPDPKVQNAATRSLGQIKASPAVSALAALLRDEHCERELRSAAARALAQISDATAISTLVDMTGYHDRHVGQAVAESLVAVGTPAVQSLLTALAEKACRSETEAIKVLGLIGDATAVPLLSAKLTDKAMQQNPWVLEATARSLGQIRDASAVPALVEALENCLRDEVQSAAVISLGQIGHASAVPALLTSLKSKNVYYEVRSKIPEALAQIRDPRAIPALEEMQKDQNCYVGCAAREALATMRKSTS
jgi:HEAT repeat protein